MFLNCGPNRAEYDRTEPVGGDISVMAEAALVRQTPKTPAERRMYEQIAKGKEKISSMSLDGNDDVEETDNAVAVESKGTNGRCFYTNVPHFVKQAGMTAPELTALNMDKVSDLATLEQLWF